MPRGGKDGGWRNVPGNGTHARGNVYVNCMFDPETFEGLRATALHEHTSISYQIRKFVDWGMEAQGANGASSPSPQHIRPSRPKNGTATQPSVTVPGNARTTRSK